jgi:hypothetical protein
MTSSRMERCSQLRLVAFSGRVVVISPVSKG